MMSNNCLRQLMNVHKNNLIDIYKFAVEAVKPDRLLLDSIKLQGNTLIIKSSDNSSEDNVDGSIKIDLLDKNVHILGGGKCVLSMAKGLADMFTTNQSDSSHCLTTSLFSHGCLSLPIGLQDDLDNDKATRALLKRLNVTCLFGSENNLPDSKSIEASKFILSQVVEACQRDKLDNRQPLFIVLISGGGSACLSSPRYISLEKKLDLIKHLVERGANIVELNKVRRYYSNIKGGNLARHILKSNPNAQIVTLLLSDVIGDPIEFIASGPTYLEDIQQQPRQHYESMCSVLNRYQLQVPSHVEDKDHYELGAVRSQVINRIIGNNRIALGAVASKAKSLGYVVKNLGDSMSGPSEQVVDRILRESSTLDCCRETDSGYTGHQPILFCCGGETTVERGANGSWGKGGRAQEMALDYMISKLSVAKHGLVDKSSTGEKNTAIDFFLAGGTDGQDGPTDVAACLASLSELSASDSKGQLDATSKGLSLNELKLAKTTHDSYNFWQSTKPDWLVKTGLTGTNVMDLYLYLVDCGRCRQ